MRELGELGILLIRWVAQKGENRLDARVKNIFAGNAFSGRQLRRARPSFLRLYLRRVDNAGPGEKFVERRSDLLVGQWIGMREKDRRVGLPRFAGRDPIEIAFAIGSEAKTPAPALRSQIERIFLALEVEGKKCLDPLRRILRLKGIFRVSGRAPDFDLLCEYGLVIVVECDQTLRKRSRNSLFDLRRIRMNESATKRIARRLNLLRSEPVPKLMHQSAHGHHSHEHHEGNHKRAERLDEERLHEVMILNVGTKRRKGTTNRPEHFRPENPYGSAGITSVFRKSSPLKRSGLPVALARA